MNDGTVEELVSDAVTKALKSSIEDQFNWKGEAKKIMSCKYWKQAEKSRFGFGRGGYCSTGYCKKDFRKRGKKI